VDQVTPCLQAFNCIEPIRVVGKNIGIFHIEAEYLQERIIR
jgi:hypothetical protein